jgi:uncharacterized protein with FMN-binding domain
MLFKRLIWAGLGMLGVTVLVVIWRYKPPKLVATQAPVLVTAVATPTPSTVGVGSKSVNTPAAGTGPTPKPGASTTPTPIPVGSSTPTPTTAPGHTPTPTPAPTHTPAPTPTTTPTPTPNQGPYKNGSYTGSTYQAVGYGPVQIKVVISNGYITDVVFLQMPSGSSQTHTDYAEPILKSETLQAQSASINTVSGATQTSGAYKSSLNSALILAQ